MRWFPLCVLVAGSVVLGASASAAASPAAPPSSERVRSYAVSLDLSADGVLNVHEDIGYDFGNSPGRHGIEREIPTKRVKIGDVRVHSADAPAVSRITRKKNLLDVRIGDPATAVSGVRHYMIDYDVRNVVASDTLDWNAIGTEWSVPIDVATVVLKGPAAYRSLGCQAGPAGAMKPCKGMWNTGGGSAAFGQSMGAREGLTVRAKFPSGTIRNQRSDGFAWKVGVPGLVALGLALLFGLGGCGLLLVEGWRRQGLRPFVTREEAPPVEIGSIPNVAEPGDPLSVLALDLAVRGHVRIADDGRHVMVTRVGSATDALEFDYERAFMEVLSDVGGSVEVGPDEPEPVKPPRAKKTKRAVKAALSGGAAKAKVRAEKRARFKPVEQQILQASRERGRRYQRSWMARFRRIVLPACWLVGIVGAVLIVVEAWADGRYGDLAATGTALVVIAVVFAWLRPVSPLTRVGQELSIRHQGFINLLWYQREDDDTAGDERHFALHAAWDAGLWMVAFHRARSANDTLPSWYSYTGDPAQAEDRFSALRHMFAGKYVAPRRTRPAPHRSRPSSGGYRRSGGGWGGHDNGGGWSGGGGHGGGGHGDGGGGGHSW
ncbi:DUF2207 domain-containing protein [Spirillospora sp. NPDC052269]